MTSGVKSLRNLMPIADTLHLNATYTAMITIPADYTIMMCGTEQISGFIHNFT